jgi:hypothetical protein
VVGLGRQLDHLLVQKVHLSSVAKGGFVSTGTIWLISIIAVVAIAFLLPRAVRATRSYFKFRGKRLVTCPETQRPAAVEVDAAKAAVAGATRAQHLELSQCSRWPEKAGCGQECLRQIEAAPFDCLVRTIVTRWYEGKACAICGKIIHEVEWLGHKPALRNPEGKTVYWDSIAAEKLPEVFATHGPVCWDCHIAETLLREHPELVVVRSPKWYP